MGTLFLIWCLITLLLFIAGVIGCIADPYSKKRWPENVMGASACALSISIVILLIHVIIRYVSAN